MLYTNVFLVCQFIIISWSCIVILGANATMICTHTIISCAYIFMMGTQVHTYHYIMCIHLYDGYTGHYVVY